MLIWKDPMVDPNNTIMIPPVAVNHGPRPVSKSLSRYIPWVDRGLETNIWKRLGIQTFDTCDCLSNHMATFVVSNYDITAHSHDMSENRWLMFKIPHSVGLSCFQIAHDELCTGLFSSRTKESHTVDHQTCNPNSRQMKSTKTSNCVYNMIWSMYGDIQLKESFESDSE